MKKLTKGPFILITNENETCTTGFFIKIHKGHVLFGVCLGHHLVYSNNEPDLRVAFAPGGVCFGQNIPDIDGISMRDLAYAVSRLILGDGKHYVIGVTNHNNRVVHQCHGCNASGSRHWEMVGISRLLNPSVPSDPSDRILELRPSQGSFVHEPGCIVEYTPVWVNGYMTMTRVRGDWKLMTGIMIQQQQHTLPHWPTPPSTSLAGEANASEAGDREAGDREAAACEENASEAGVREAATPTASGAGIKRTAREASACEENASEVGVREAAAAPTASGASLAGEANAGEASVANECGDEPPAKRPRRAKRLGPA